MTYPLVTFYATPGHACAIIGVKTCRRYPPSLSLFRRYRSREGRKKAGIPPALSPLSLSLSLSLSLPDGGSSEQRADGSPSGAGRNGGRETPTNDAEEKDKVLLSHGTKEKPIILFFIFHFRGRFERGYNK
jgi:hypothetical protein